MKKILHIISQYPGKTGSGIYLQELIREGNKKNYIQGLIAGIPNGDSIKLSYIDKFYPLIFNTEELPFPILGTVSYTHLDKVHAVVLSGGSAFGLEAASGVMRYLEEQNIGFDVGVTKVPIVASAVIFDLNIGNCKIRPDFNMGYIAAKNANVNNIQGNVGCGMGATIGKILGPENAMKSGLGSATIKVGELIVSAMVAVNSFGDIYDYKNNKQIAGVYDYKNNKLLNTIDIMKNKNRNLGFNIQNTTIGIIATNAKLTKAEANKISEMAHNGFARSINPIHTMVDGDTIFTMEMCIRDRLKRMRPLGKFVMFYVKYLENINSQ